MQSCGLWGRHGYRTWNRSKISSWYGVVYCLLESLVFAFDCVGSTSYRSLGWKNRYLAFPLQSVSLTSWWSVIVNMSQPYMRFLHFVSHRLRSSWRFRQLTDMMTWYCSDYTYFIFKCAMFHHYLLYSLKISESLRCTQRKCIFRCLRINRNRGNGINLSSFSIPIPSQ